MEVFLLLGSNLGDRRKYLHDAKVAIVASCGQLMVASAVYETAAWGQEDQPAFYNQVLQIETDLGPEGLLREAHNIEQSLGRTRYKKWGERTIDIDILYYGDTLVQQPNLTIPHPEIANRRFTLMPLAEIAPDWEHPGVQKTNKRLLEECPDQLDVVRLPE